MDKIKGYIDHLIFRNSDNGYTVMVVNHEGEELTCVGTFPVITEGELIEATGYYTEHAVYGTQFQIQKLEIKDPEDTADRTLSWFRCDQRDRNRTGSQDCAEI